MVRNGVGSLRKRMHPAYQNGKRFIGRPPQTSTENPLPPYDHASSPASISIPHRKNPEDTKKTNSSFSEFEKSALARYLLLQFRITPDDTIPESVLKSEHLRNIRIELDRLHTEHRYSGLNTLKANLEGLRANSRNLAVQQKSFFATSEQRHQLNPIQTPASGRTFLERYGNNLSLVLIAADYFEWALQQHRSSINVGRQSEQRRRKGQQLEQINEKEPKSELAVLMEAEKEKRMRRRGLARRQVLPVNEEPKWGFMGYLVREFIAPTIRAVTSLALEPMSANVEECQRELGV